MFRGDPARTGFYPVPGPENLRQIKWRYKTGGKVRSSPAVAAGAVCFGSEDGHLYAVHPDSGELIWKFHTGGDLSSSPAIMEKGVFFSGGDDHFYRVSLKDGKRQWRFKTGPILPYEFLGGDPKSFDYYQSSPVIVDGVFYCGSGDGHLYAIQADSGKLEWKFKTAGRIRSSPAYSEGTIFFGSFDGYLYALNAANGEQKWKFKTEGNAAFPMGEIQSSPAVAGGQVYFGSRDGFLYCLEAASGKEKWRFDHKMSWVITSPAISQGLVFCGSSDGRFLQAVMADSGQEKWRYDAKSRIFSSPAIADGRVYFGNGDGILTALEITSGAVQAQCSAEVDIHSSPVIANGELYYGSDDSCVYAIEAKVRKSRSIVTVSSNVLDSYAGEYKLFPGFNLIFARKGDQLTLQGTGQPAIPLSAVSDCEFIFDPARIELSFEKDEQGRVFRVRFIQNDTPMLAPRLRTE